jgi:hypothetical protein
VTVREPEYNDRDRARLFALRGEDLIPRGSHGLPLSEATDPAYQYEWRVPLPTQDFAKAKLDAEQEAFKKQYPDADMGSLLWRVTRGVED